MNKKYIIIFWLILVVVMLLLIRTVKIRKGKNREDTTASIKLSTNLAPSEDEIFNHLQILYKQGVRRPGYPADLWAEEYIFNKFKEYGLEDVHKEKVTHHGKDYTDQPEINLKWTPIKIALIVYNQFRLLEIPAFSVPFAKSTSAEGIDLEIVEMESKKINQKAKGKIALYPVKFRSGTPHFLLGRIARWVYDPRGTFAERRQPPVVSVERRETMRYAIQSGAKGFIGVITNNPDPEQDFSEFC